MTVEEMLAVISQSKDETLRVVDTEGDNVLTVDEIKQLKELAQMSRTVKYFMAAVFGVASIIGFPALMEFLKHHWVW